MLLLINASRSVQFLFFYITSAKFRVNFQSQNSHHRASQISMRFRSPKSIFHFINTQRAQTSLRLLQDVLKRSRRLMTKPNIVKTSGKRRLIYDALKTSYLRGLEEVQCTTSWRRLIYNVLRTSDLRRLEDVRFTLP